MSKGKSKGKRFTTLILDEPMQIADPITGEVRTITRMVVPYGYKDRDFCKVYYKTINKLTELPRSCQKVFDRMLEHMDFENKVYIPNQKELAKELGLAYITVRKAITELTKRGFIKKVNTALYMINPSLVCKVSDNRDILVQFVGAEDFEDFVKRIKKKEKEKEENSQTTKV